MSVMLYVTGNTQVSESLPFLNKEKKPGHHCKSVWKIKDMLYATIGVILGLFIFSRYQDMKISKITPG